MSEQMLFYYLGDDEPYFKALQGEFKKYGFLSIKFQRHFETQEEQIQSLFVKIFKQKPTVVFIDFSKCTHEFLHLARLLIRVPLEHNLLTVGLVDYLSPREVVEESISTGVSMTHIKSAEIFDVAYDVAKLLTPDQVPEHGFAMASLNENVSVGLAAKIGYVYPEGIHIETDYPLKQGQKLKIKHFWTKGQIVPSQVVTVNKVMKSNLFYHFKQSADLDFMFVDEYHAPKGTDEKIVIAKRLERDDYVFHHKKLLKKWISDNQTSSQAKKSKILIVDNEFASYQNQKRSDREKFLIRCIGHFRDVQTEIEQMDPQVIAFCLHRPQNEVKRNTMEDLQKLTETLRRKSPERQPYIVVFNCETESKDLQTALNYPQIMTSKLDVELPVLIRMTELVEKKLILSKVMKGTDPSIVYINKRHPSSTCEFCFDIKVLKISETDILFQCEAILPEGTNLHLESPIDMYINVRPVKGQSGTPVYSGLIHCLGEMEKIELRKYVQSIFFRDHDAQISAELDEYKKLNEAKLQEKVKETEKSDSEDSPEKEKIEGQ